MRRRRFVTGLPGISALALASPGLRAQQSARPRRVAVLMLYAEDDREGQARARAFREDPPATIFAHADEVLE